jgi:hypothetical protein
MATVTPASVAGSGVPVARTTPLTVSPVQKIVPMEPFAGTPG